MKKFLSLYILLSAILISCNDNYIGDDDSGKLLMEGWIKEGGYPIVMLMSSVQVKMEKSSVEELYKHIGNWGRVVISDGEKSVVLTGMYDTDYYPPYIYTTTDMKGVVGKTYTIEAQWKGQAISATTTIPESVPLKSITQNKVEGNDTLWSLQGNFNAPSGEHYYSFFYRIGAEAQQSIKCDVGTFDNSAVNPDNIPGKEVSYPVYRTKTLDKYYGVTEYFNEGDTVCVELCTMDSISFNIWQDYQNISSLSGNMFVPYTKSIRTNVVGGYGYWCGYGTSRKWTVVGQELRTR